MFYSNLYISIIIVFRKSGEKPDSRLRSSHANISLHGITTDNHPHGNKYQCTPLHDSSNKGNTSDTHDIQQESPETPENTGPSTDNFPVYALPEKDKKNENKLESASAAKENIPEYALPNKDKKNVNTPNSATRQGIPVYSLPNKGTKNTNTPGAQAGNFEDPEEAYAYSPVSYNPPKEDRQRVMQGANGNEEAGWMENNIYNVREEYEGSRGKEGWKANSIYDTVEEY